MGMTGAVGCDFYNGRVMGVAQTLRTTPGNDGVGGVMTLRLDGRARVRDREGTGGRDWRRTWWDGEDVCDTLTTRIHQQYMPDVRSFGAVLCVNSDGAEPGPGRGMARR